MPIEILPFMNVPVMQPPMQPPLQPPMMAAPPPMMAPAAAPGMIFNPESRVSAMWTDGAWYPGEVGQYDPGSGQYFVHFDDGSEAWIPATAVMLMPMPFPPGSWVNAFWEDAFYPAQIVQAADGWYLVHWQADNSESWVGADLAQPLQ
jgi:hypothetical protein